MPLILPDRLLALLKSQNGWLLVFLVLAVMVAGLNASLQAWCVRTKAFGHTSASQVVRGVSAGCMQVGFGLARLGAPGLVLSSVFAEVLAGLNLLRLYAPRSPRCLCRHAVEPPEGAGVRVP